ncbi:unnamed protein product [Rotaria sp. Silwood2]|nr:unnamed protein product [Rotaria sp. Silwood2]
MITLLENMLNHHPWSPARGNAFILLPAMDQSDHKVIINAINTLLDENIVKEYTVIGIPLIHLSSNEFIDDLLESLRNESAIKTYEILKIFTEFALNEKIDTNNDTAYNMAVRADKLHNEKHWHDKPIFDKAEIYKESFLTDKILELLYQEKSPD